MNQFRIKSDVVVEAFQYDGEKENSLDLFSFCDDFLKHNSIEVHESKAITFELDYSGVGDSIEYRMEVGDWLVRTESGVYAAHSNRNFRDFFEENVEPFKKIGYANILELQETENSDRTLSLSKMMTVCNDIPVYVRSDS